MIYYLSPIVNLFYALTSEYIETLNYISIQTGEIKVF